MSNLSEEIAKTAYELYEKRGMADGSALADWLKAEQIVRERMARIKKDSAMPMQSVKLESEKKKSKKTFSA